MRPQTSALHHTQRCWRKEYRGNPEGFRVFMRHFCHTRKFHRKSIREHLEHVQEKLWRALKEARIDMVVSDHSPCTVDLKKLGTGNFLEAWGGIASLQFGLPLFWTSAKKRGFSLQDVVMLLCQKPAELSSLASRKASLLPGYDADIVIWDPDKEFEITEECVHHKNKLTPYLGCKLHGEVIATIVAGKMTYIKGQFAREPPGQLLFVK
ncbi:ALN1 allantoinase, partial [Polypterus senegalus]